MNLRPSSKVKQNLFQYLRSFVSASIYILMLLVAVFIFYKVVILIVHVFQFASYEAGDLFLQAHSGAQSNITFIETLLNNITFILILVKGFKILESYAQYHHIEIKDLVEISIIALIMEVVFNFGVHSLAINILFSVVGICLLIVYAGMPYFRKR
ncbi:MAG: hypothetical protein H6767_02200 [Candidatus Peribacteria bacterium]|nr:MAG: hypothetical protein H6767_02200 [Candidatus Peribacteria bacterium]